MLQICNEGLKPQAVFEAANPGGSFFKYLNQIYAECGNSRKQAIRSSRRQTFSGDFLKHIPPSLRSEMTVAGRGPRSRLPGTASPRKNGPGFLVRYLKIENRHLHVEMIHCKICVGGKAEPKVRRARVLRGRSPCRSLGPCGPDCPAKVGARGRRPGRAGLLALLPRLAPRPCPDPGPCLPGPSTPAHHGRRSSRVSGVLGGDFSH